MADDTGGSHEGFRISEALPQPSDPAVPRITDRDITATCPRCGVERFMYDCDIGFYPKRTVYRCPKDGEPLAEVESADEPGKLLIKSLVGISVHVRGPNYEGPRWDPSAGVDE